VLHDVGEVLLEQEKIAGRVAQLGRKITTDYADKDIVLLAALKGAVVFLADLMRHIELPVCLGFVSAASYGQGTASSGDVTINLDACGDLGGRDVLIVEDIVDSGRTLVALVQAVRQLGASSVKTCCLLDKPSRRVVDIEPDYWGFVIGDEFVVGYGLDYAERYRNLPFVAVLKPQVHKQ